MADTDFDATKANTSGRKPVRIWVDGCFDMMHFGHANALRQAKELGDYMIVGVHSDEAIRKNKGPTVMNEQERYKAVRACKWVDEVVEDAPYVTELSMIEKHNVDFVVHGDDLVTASDGSDCYAEVKKAGKFQIVKRTKGISTTDLVGRMLLLTKTHFIRRNDDGIFNLVKKEQSRVEAFSNTPGRPQTVISQFIPTVQKIEQFTSGKVAQANDKIVYLDGSFDLFHVGHIDVLQKAKELGTYLICGVYDDQTVNNHQGRNLPIMNVYERVLGVLSCRYVDEVVIGAPIEVTKDFIESLKISVVATGSVPHSYREGVEPVDYYKVPKEMNIFQRIESPSKLTTPEVIERILENHSVFEARNKLKEEKEKKASGQAFTN